MQAPSLKQCTAAIEELARSELGMIKRGEVFYQVLENPFVQMTEKQLSKETQRRLSQHIADGRFLQQRTVAFILPGSPVRINLGTGLLRFQFDTGAPEQMKLDTE